jgi:hypothetical protein
MNLEAINEQLSGYNLEIREADDGYFQLYEYEELQLHVEGWDNFWMSLQRDQGQLILDEVDTIPAPTMPQPDDINWDGLINFDCEVYQSGRRWIFKVDGEIRFTSIRWERFYPRLVEQLGTAFVHRQLLP